VCITVNGNEQEGMLQIDAPPVEIFWLRHCRVARSVISRARCVCSDEQRLVIDTASPAKNKSTDAAAAAAAASDEEDDVNIDETRTTELEPATKKRRLIISDDDDDGPSAC